MVVQRKWMYLESIFIGGDIRAQLPEEAKKFDNIDKTFKKAWNFDGISTSRYLHIILYACFKPCANVVCLNYRLCLILPRTPGYWRRATVQTDYRIWRCSATGWSDARRVWMTILTPRGMPFHASSSSLTMSCFLYWAVTSVPVYKNTWLR